MMILSHMHIMYFDQIYPFFLIPLLKTSKWVSLLYFHACKWSTFFFFSVLGFELRAYTLSSTSPFLCRVFFEVRVLQTIYSGWLLIMSLLITASWVARITGVSLRCPAIFYFLKSIFQTAQGPTKDSHLSQQFRHVRRSMKPTYPLTPLSPYASRVKGEEGVIQERGNCFST
jgi:hypothetical protein